MRVLNKRTDKVLEGAVYVGRPSKWGNPYRIGDFFAGKILTREDCIMLHREYLRTNAGKVLLRDLDELRGKDLVCWCHTWNGIGINPMYCHADILLELANF